MTKLCVGSDSHGYAGQMLRAVEEEQPDAVIFLGDGEAEFELLRERFPEKTILGVRGNCDWGSPLPLLLRTEIAGKRIFATHGHQYNVKLDREYLRLSYAAAEAGAELVLFGHTHRPFRDSRMGLELLNPGSIGTGPRLSYGLVRIDGDRLETGIVYPPQA